MTTVLVWKVYREQRLVWLAMAAVALGLFVLDATVLEPGPNRDGLGVLFCMIAYINGLVVGALLLAGEREDGTATFLETLPATRLLVWRAKAGVGFGLVCFHLLFLGLLLDAAGAFHDAGWAAQLLELLIGCGLLGFAWGLFFSGRSRTPMGAIFAAVLGQATVAPIVIGLWASIFWLLPQRPSEFAAVLPLFGLGGLLVAGPLVASGVSHGRLDRLRRRDPGWWSQLAALVWIELRQVGRPFLWLLVFVPPPAFLLTLGVLVWPVLPLGVLVWPALTLLLGVLAGVSVFAGDQAEGAGRFLSEQRLPPTMVWAVKVGIRLILAGGIILLLLIVAASSRAIPVSFSDPNEAGKFRTYFQRLEPFLQLGPYLTLFFAHGFGVGCLCGLLIHKPLVAGLVAIGASLMLVTLWAPSLLVGGLHGWQTWGVPILLLLTTRLLIWPWATRRLYSRGAITSLMAGLTLAGLWFAVAIGYRVVEIPLVNDTPDVAAYRQRLEAERNNGAGERIERILTQVRALKQRQEQRMEELLPVCLRGWPAAKPGLGNWLDEVFQQPLAAELKTVTGLPLGLLVSLQSPETLVPFHANSATELLVARGLQLQARGDPAPFVDNMAASLALQHQIYHGALGDVAIIERPDTYLIRRGLERWLERLSKRPDLLRRVLILIFDFDQAMAKDLEDRVLAGTISLSNGVNKPTEWIKQSLQLTTESVSPLPTMVWLAWQTPWEQARLQRIVRALNDQPADSLPVPELISQLRRRFIELGPHPRPQSKKKFRMWPEELMVALRLYEAETGQPARTLQDLIPKILPSVPVEPGTGRPYRYRLSRGEEVRVVIGHAIQTRKVPAGQGILTTQFQNILVPVPAGQ